MPTWLIERIMKFLRDVPLMTSRDSIALSTGGYSKIIFLLDLKKNLKSEFTNYIRLEIILNKDCWDATAGKTMFNRTKHCRVRYAVVHLFIEAAIAWYLLGKTLESRCLNRFCCIRKKSINSKLCQFRSKTKLHKMWFLRGIWRNLKKGSCCSLFKSTRFPKMILITLCLFVGVLCLFLNFTPEPVKWSQSNGWKDSQTPINAFLKKKSNEFCRLGDRLNRLAFVFRLNLAF